MRATFSGGAARGSENGDGVSVPAAAPADSSPAPLGREGEKLAEGLSSSSPRAGAAEGFGGEEPGDEPPLFPFPKKPLLLGGGFGGGLRAASSARLTSEGSEGALESVSPGSTSGSSSDAAGPNTDSSSCSSSAERPLIRSRPCSAASRASRRSSLSSAQTDRDRRTSFVAIAARSSARKVVVSQVGVILFKYPPTTAPQMLFVFL